MKPKRIILVRHGESEGNVDGSIYESVPDYKLKLTQLGEEQALNAGYQLKQLIGEESCMFFISPFHRTRRTAELLMESLVNNPIQSVEDPRIREQEWGHYRDVQQSSAIEKARDEYGTFFYRIPEGESGADVFDRVSDFIGMLYRTFEKADFPENCIIVTHAMTMRIFLMRWLRWTVEEFENVRKPGNCEMYILEKDVDRSYALASSLELRASSLIPPCNKSGHPASYYVKSAMR